MMSRESSAPDSAAEFEKKIQSVQDWVDYEAEHSPYNFSLSWTPSHSKSLLQLQASGGKMSRMSTDSYFEKYETCVQGTGYQRVSIEDPEFTETLQQRMQSHQGTFYQKVDGVLRLNQNYQCTVNLDRYEKLLKTVSNVKHLMKQKVFVHVSDANLYPQAKENAFCNQYARYPHPQTLHELAHKDKRQTLFPELPTNERVLIDPTQYNYLLTLMIHQENDAIIAVLDPRLWSIEHPKQKISQPKTLREIGCKSKFIPDHLLNLVYVNSAKDMLCTMELLVPYFYRVFLDHTQAPPKMAIEKSISKVENIADDTKVDLEKAIDDGNTSLIAETLVKMMEDAEEKILVKISSSYDSTEDECDDKEAERKKFSSRSKISHLKAKIASAGAFVGSEAFKKMMLRGLMLEGEKEDAPSIYALVLAAVFTLRMAESTPNGEILRQTIKKDMEYNVKKWMAAEMKNGCEEYNKVDRSIATFFSGYEPDTSMGVVAAPTFARKPYAMTTAFERKPSHVSNFILSTPQTQVEVEAQAQVASGTATQAKFQVNAATQTEECTFRIGGVIHRSEYFNIDLVQNLGNVGNGLELLKKAMAGNEETLKMLGLATAITVENAETSAAAIFDTVFDRIHMIAMELGHKPPPPAPAAAPAAASVASAAEEEEEEQPKKKKMRHELAA